MIDERQLLGRNQPPAKIGYRPKTTGDVQARSVFAA
jgi:hypothetical protein